MLCAAGCTDPLLQSRLVDAARGGRLREVQDGLRRGAQVDVLDQGSLAIVEAATYGHTEVVDELLAHGADPNKEDGYGQVAIQWAALNGNVDMTRNLLDHGAAIEKGDPLACASMQGQVPVIDLLLDRKADVGRHTPGEETAIELAASHGHAEAVAVLLRRGAPRDRAEYALLGAAQQGQVEAVRVLLDNGIEVSIYGDTALFNAVRADAVPLVRLLLDRGAHLRARGGDGRAPLALAAWTDHPDVVRILLDYGADVDARDDRQRTALMDAAWNGNAESLSLLLASHTNPELRNDGEQTAPRNRPLP